MSENYQRILAASDEDRRGIFLTAAQRLGTTLQNVEKDFWVCWTLSSLFNQRPPSSPRLLFKGGTSLSKAHNLITRFSEDIDITVFRSDIGVEASPEQLLQLSKNARRKRLDEIKSACQSYINGDLLTHLKGWGEAQMSAAGQDPRRLVILPDEHDQDHQSLLIQYPTVAITDGYISAFVKIESGAKSAMDPNEARTIVPYVAVEMGSEDNLAVQGVTTIDPARTFIDKVLILHGLPIYYSGHGRIYGAGQVSRHYYDVHCMMSNAIGQQACSDEQLIESCISHAQMFFYRKDTGLDEVRRGGFRLTPNGGLLDELLRDYERMKTMIFGDVPDFNEILGSVAAIENTLNAI